MLISSWLDSLRSFSSFQPRSRGGVSRRAPRLAGAAEFLEDRVMLSAAAPDLPRINATAEAASVDDYEVGELLVRFNSGFSDAERSAAIESLGGEILQRYDSIDAVQVKIDEPAVRIVTDVTRFIANPVISYAEPNYHVSPLTIPNDTNFTSLWGLNNTGQTGGTVDADIDAVEAWTDFTGTTKSIVAVIDSGIQYTHPDLAGNMWFNPGEIAGNSIDDDFNGLIDDVHGYDFSNGDADIIDDAPAMNSCGGCAGGHGSHVSGTIGATGNNATGVVGVNWDVSLMGAKIFPDAFSSVVLAAVNYVTIMRQSYGINITAINASYGSTFFSQAEKDSIAATNAAGVVFVAAAGNSNVNNDGAGRSYPASYDLDGIISVAATTHTDALVGFSNYGLTSVDLGAPGVDIYSTVPASVSSSLYYSTSGTSMAAPQVTGVVGLLRGMRPSLSVQQTKDAILNTVNPVPGLSGKTVTGGRLNLAAAITEVAGNVVVSANENGIGDNFVVKRVANNLVVTIDSVISTNVAYASVTGVAILGSSDDDTLTIDHTGGVINVPMIYTAFDGVNTLKVIGDLDYTLADSGSGLVSSNASTAMLFSPGAGTVELAYVDSVELTGGSTANSLVATTFTRGSVVLNGGDGDDSLYGSSGDDILNGGNGNDLLLGGPGNDTFWGGDGNDSLDGGDDSDVVRQVVDLDQVLTDVSLTGRGSDTLVSIEQANLTGGPGGDTLDARNFSGTVTLNGLLGDDTLWGGDGDDSLDGGDGSDVVHQVVDLDQVLTDVSLTGRGSDTLVSVEQAVLTGGPLDNSLDASGFTTGPVTLVGGTGNDTLAGSQDNDSLDGGDGTDRITQAADTDHVLNNGTATGHGTDTLTSIEEAHLAGGPGDNTLDASAFTLGSVTLEGLAGDDSLFGSNSADSLDGGANDDLFVALAGNDTLSGGTGVDELHQTADADQVLTDYLVTGDGPDVLSSIEHAVLTGGSGDNTLNASAFTLGPVTLNGGAGNDTLAGTLISDSLDGGDGIDTNQVVFDGDLVLTDTTLIGPVSDTLIAIERFTINGGNGPNRIDASAYTLGSVTLDGGSGDDTLLGSAADDLLIGGDGTDTLEQTADTDMVLTTSSLASLTGFGTDTLSGFEQAVLTGGPLGNSLDASGFTTGPVTLVGGTGNDTLAGSQDNDSLDGGDGTDRITQAADTDHVLNNGTATGHGTDTLTSIEEAHLAGGPGDNTLDAQAFTLGSVTLEGLGGDDSLYGSTGGDSLDGGDGDDLFVAFAGDDTLSGGTGTDELRQTADADQVLTDNLVTGDGPDVISSIEQAVLTGGSGDNTLDAQAFTLGSVTLEGLGGDDSLYGSTAADSLDGGDGDDLFVAFAGDDTLSGGTGVDELRQTEDADQVLTDTQVTGQGSDLLSTIERAVLTGGFGDNTLDAQAFTLGSVTLEGLGGNDSLYGSTGGDSLDGGDGDDLFVALAGDDTLSGGTGVDELRQTEDADQVLTDTQVTGQGSDLLSSIERAVLTGGSGDNTLDAQAFTLGSVTLEGLGGDDSLYGSTAADSLDGGDGDDLFVAFAGDDTLSGGTGVDELRQTEDADQVLTDTQVTGQGSDLLSSIERAVLTGGFGDNTLDAQAFTLGSVTLEGLGGNDSLYGSTSGDSLDGGDGDDLFVALAGDDTLSGGTGVDELRQTEDADQVLTDTQVTGQGSDVLSSIEKAVITGGDSDNSLDALGFDSGTVTLAGAGGNDTMVGSPGDDLVDGGDGIDLVVSSGDVNFVLTDSAISGVGNDLLVDVETIHLAGGISANTLDASSFTGSTTLEGGDGDDTLLGGSGIDLVLQTSDTDQVLTTTSLSGLGQNTLSNIDQAHLVGGGGDNLLDASGFSPGPVTLEGAGGDDTLHGSSGDDNLVGGSGTDRVVSTGSANQVLADNSLVGDSNDTLVGIEEAELYGSGADNVLDASGFSGDTTLYGSPGNDTLTGGSSTDLLRQSVDADQSLSDSQLTGQGTDQLSGIELAWLSGGSGDNTLDAQAFSLGPVTLDGGQGNDTLVGSSSDDRLIGSEGIDLVRQQSDSDQWIVDSMLSGQGADLLFGIEEAQLTGGTGNNLIDATGFSAGEVTLAGMAGDDTLRGSLGDDSLDGGPGSDRVEQFSDADQSLTNSQLTGRGSDVLDSIETALLTGGPGDNRISASAFTLGPVTLWGAAGNDSLTGGSRDDLIHGGDGDDVANGRGGNDLILGGNGNDSFSGGSGADTLEGDSGDDSLNGQGGRDLIRGGSGNDSLNGAGSPDTVIGDSGDDRIAGGSSGDVLNGSSGNDVIDGGSGSDRIFGGSGTDTLEGGSGEDRLNGQGGSGDVVNGNAGDDTVRGGSGDDLLDGGTGYDELREGGNVDFRLDDNQLSGMGNDQIVSFETARLTGGGSANWIDTTEFSGPVTLQGSGGDDLLQSADYDDLLLGGNGNDTLESGSGLDTLNGGRGIDRVKTSGDGDFLITDTSVTGPMTGLLIGIEAADITGGAGDNVLDASGFTGDTTLWGGSGRDVIIGGIGNDWLNGNDGDDALTGGGGNDLIHGGEGADLMFGGDGDDTLNGEAGDDTIDGGAGNDRLIGKEGRDRLLGQDGDDSLFGGDGNDHLLGHDGRDRLNGESGNDVLLGGDGDDALRGGNGNDVISGDAGNDRLYGQAGNDTLLGASGNDQLQGGSARDVLQGGDDDDTLNGQSGHDTLSGGDGNDRINPHDNSAVVNELFALPDELFEAIEEIRG